MSPGLAGSPASTLEDSEDLRRHLYDADLFDDEACPTRRRSEPQPTLLRNRSKTQSRRLPGLSLVGAEGVEPPTFAL